LPNGAFLLLLMTVLTVRAASHPAQGKAPAEPDLNATVAGSPAELRNGVATRAQVIGFLGVDDSELHGEPVWEIIEDDLDADGAKDLLISNHLNTTEGGNTYAVFIGSPKGYRYVGNFTGDIRMLPAEAGKPVRFVIASFAGDKKMTVELAELQASGLRRIKKAEMVTGGCEAQDNPTFTALVCAEKISMEAVTKVFGS
jgi:hypothetical protein